MITFSNSYWNRLFIATFDTRVFQYFVNWSLVVETIMYYVAAVLLRYAQVYIDTSLHTSTSNDWPPTQIQLPTVRLNMIKCVLNLFYMRILNKQSPVNSYDNPPESDFFCYEKPVWMHSFLAKRRKKVIKSLTLGPGVRGMQSLAWPPKSDRLGTLWLKIGNWETCDANGKYSVTFLLTYTDFITFLSTIPEVWFRLFSFL